jgi:hypothetical protein
MKRNKARQSSIGILGTAVVTATLLGLGFPQSAKPASNTYGTSSGVYVTILSPTTGASDSSKQIEISAFYQASATSGGISTLELYIDGQQEAVKNLDSPENKGVVSFVISPGTISAGKHDIVVRVAAADAEIASATTTLNIQQAAQTSTTPAPALGGTISDGTAPSVAITTPTANSTVDGTIDIKVDAHDDSGKPPYVSLFIDHNFKTLRNFPPFDFAWDTTRVANGYHTIEVWGYNDAQAVGHAQPLTVFVNNPGGRTLVRHDLLDTVPVRSSVKTAARLVAMPVQHHAVIRPHAVLAQGPIAKPTKIERLSVAKIDPDSSSLSDQSLLMSPFLPKIVPQPSQIATTIASPVAVAFPSLATSPAQSAFYAANSLEETNSGLTSPEATALLTPPTVVEFVEKTAIQASAPAAPKPTAVKLEATVANVPPSDNSALKLESSVSTTVTDDQNGPTLEAPVVNVVKVSQPIALAPGNAAATMTISPTRMASASIDSSSLFTQDPSLQAPRVSLNPIVNIVNTHRVQAHIVSLGTSPNGFSLSRVLSNGGAYQVVMNDRAVKLDQPLEAHNNFLFAPFRQIFESEGGVMAWNPTLHSVHALSANRDIELTIGSKIALVNQQSISLNASPYIVRGHTMIPLAFVPIALSATVSYDPTTGHIIINSNN